MKRHPALIPFSHDHRHMLFLSQLMKKNGPVYDGFPIDLIDKVHYLERQFEFLIKPHFKKEETEIFDQVKKILPIVENLCNELAGNHQLIISLIDGLIINPQVEMMDKIGFILEEHIRKEERILFEMIQKELPEGFFTGLKNRHT